MGTYDRNTEGEFYKAILEDTKSWVDKKSDIILPLAKQLTDKNSDKTDAQKERMKQIILENIESAKLYISRLDGNNKIRQERQKLALTLKQIHAMGFYRK
ncbi:MAG: hypothetical protein ACLRFI_02600 [Alphaproteobacteria bacterium]